MRYQKPTIASLGSASVAIQGNGNKLVHSQPDAINPNGLRSSGSAYDLDE